MPGPFTRLNLKFGSEFTYHNAKGNLAIDKRVLAAFKKLTGDSIIWERSLWLWRLRSLTDGPGRRRY